MADIKSIPETVERATVAKDRAYDAYELALELRSILDAIVQHGGGRSPLFDMAFSLQRMAERACLAADVAHGEVLAVLFALQSESKPATVA